MLTSSQPLAAFNARRLEEFLTELVNLRWEGNSVQRFAQRYALDFGLFDARFLSALRVKGVVANNIEEDGERVIGYFHLMFRATWVEPNAKTREWGLAVFRVELARTVPLGGKHLWLWGDSDHFRLPEPPEDLPIDKAFEYLLKHHDRARCCPNPECPAPYFFAKRHSQRYCSEKCAQSGERETKRRWWAEHGKSWRKGRKRAAIAVSKTQKKKGKKGKKGK
jgi:hypothetical protein